MARRANEQREVIIALWSNGRLTMGQIALKLRITRGQVAGVLWRAGLLTRRAHQAPLELKESA